MPAAYVIAETSVKDPKLLEQYRKLALPSVQKFGGQYLVATDTLEVLTGDWHPQRLGVVRFETIQTARNWWDSEEYREARAIRAQMGESKIIIVEGM